MQTEYSNKAMKKEKVKNKKFKQGFFFPSEGKTIEAESQEEALKKLNA